MSPPTDEQNQSQTKTDDLSKTRRMSWNERKYNLIKLYKNVQSWKKLRNLSFRRLVITAAVCIFSFGIGCYLLTTKEDDIKSTASKIITTSFVGVESLTTLITSLMSLKNLYNSGNKDANKEMYKDIEKALYDSVIDNSKQNYPRKLDSTNFSPLKFVKKLKKHIHHIMLRRQREKVFLKSIYKEYFVKIINDNKEKHPSGNENANIDKDLKGKLFEEIRKSVDDLKKQRKDPENQTINDYLKYIDNGKASDDNFVKNLKLDEEDLKILNGLKNLDTSSEQSLFEKIEKNLETIKKIEIRDNKYKVDEIAKYLEMDDKNSTFNSIITLTLCCINFDENMDENTMSLFFKGINFLLKPDHNINITRDLKIIAEALTLGTIFNDKSKPNNVKKRMEVMIEEVLVAIMRKMNEINDEIKNETDKEIQKITKVFGDVRTGIFKDGFKRNIPLYAATIILIPNLYIIGLISVSSVSCEKNEKQEKEKHLMLKRIEINDMEKEIINRLLFGLSTEALDGVAEKILEITATSDMKEKPVQDELENDFNSVNNLNSNLNSWILRHLQK
ncbi:3139_t:CDS:2, partial [Racocetra persica]